MRSERLSSLVALSVILESFHFLIPAQGLLHAMRVEARILLAILFVEADPLASTPKLFVARGFARLTAHVQVHVGRRAVPVRGNENLQRHALGVELGDELNGGRVSRVFYH